MLLRHASSPLSPVQATEVFSELTPEPVASASLGQVYKGCLITTGQQVAVKVQRLRIGESIAMDMLLLRRLMAAVDRYLPQVPFSLQIVAATMPMLPLSTVPNHTFLQI